MGNSTYTGHKDLLGNDLYIGDMVTIADGSRSSHYFTFAKITGVNKTMLQIDYYTINGGQFRQYNSGRKTPSKVLKFNYEEACNF